MPTTLSSAEASRTCAFSFPHAGRFIINAPSYRPIGLAAAQLFARRWLFYVLICVAAIGLQGAFYALLHAKFPQFADMYAWLVGPPLAGCVVMVYSGADATGALPEAAHRWSRIVERAWAVVIVDVGINLVESYGFGMMLNVADATALFTGTLMMFFAAMLVYAEPYICVQPELETLTAVPFALLRSMMLSWVNMSRIFALFAIQLAMTLVVMLAHQGAVRLGLHNAIMWVDVPLGTLLTAPIATLFTVAYLDTLAQEQRTLE